MDLYGRVFGTSEYYMYESETRTLEGLRLSGRFYRSMKPDAEGRLWSERLESYLGVWHGVREDLERDWVRLYRPDGSLVLTGEERAEVEHQRAEAGRQRAEAAEAELARLRALLEGHGAG